jgi:hypothetical protein
MTNLYQWTRSHADRTWFGTGKQKGSFTFHYLVNGKTASVFSVFTNGDILLNFAYLSVIASKEIMEEFYTKLISIQGFKGLKHDFNKFPSYKIGQAFLNISEDLSAFETFVDDVGKQLKGSAI